MASQDISDDLLPRILFLSVNNIHKHREPNCKMCSLITIFKKAVYQQSLEPLKQELKKQFQVLIDKLNDRGNKMDDFNLFELLSGDGTFDEDEEQILTFTATLEMLNIEIPKVLSEKVQQIIVENKIPVYYEHVTGQDEVKNKFFGHTLNKKLMDICDLLTLQDIFNMKTAFPQNQQGDSESIMSVLSSCDYSEEIECIKGFKETLFCCIVMIMFTECTLNRTHSHKLTSMLEEAKKKADNKTSIQKSIMTLKRYPLTDTPPGLCIVFSMLKGRSEGAAMDLQLVQKCFRNDLKYNTIIKVNPTKGDIINVSYKLKASKYMFFDSLVVFFMAHGDEDSLTVMDGKIHRRDDLIKPFTEIAWLKNKPKLFFIQACAVPRKPKLMAQVGGSFGGNAHVVKTDSISMGLQSSNEWSATYSKYLDTSKVNRLADHLVSYATMWYDMAAIDDENGSVYIKSLVDALKRLGKNASIEDVLKDTHYHVNMVLLKEDAKKELWKQTPYYESSLQKDFVFPDSTDYSHEPTGRKINLFEHLIPGYLTMDNLSLDNKMDI